MAEEAIPAPTAPLPIYFQLLWNRKGIRCYVKVSLLGQIILTCIITESNREGPSAWGFPYYQNLFPQKLHQDKGIPFMEHTSLAVLILMLLIGQVAAGDELTSVFRNSSLPRAFNYGKPYCVLDQPWEALPHEQLSPPSSARSSPQTLKFGKFIAS